LMMVGGVLFGVAGVGVTAVLRPPPPPPPPQDMRARIKAVVSIALTATSCLLPLRVEG
jgi:hypothetical protein